MDPIAVLKTLWHHRFISLPILILTIAAAVYVFQFAPRSYESSTTYALINPDIPTQKEIENNPALEQLNKKNPYLRSSDPSLIVQVLLTRLNDSSTADRLKEQGLSSDYTVSRGVGGVNGFLVDITGTAETPEASFAITRALGEMLEKDLYSAQKINGADDTYLFTSIVVASPDSATEQFSSRLRSVIAIFLAGVVLMFGSVSIARSVSVSRHRRTSQGGDLPEAGRKRRVRKRAKPPQDSDPQEPSTKSGRHEFAPESLGVQHEGSDDGERLPEFAK